LDRQVIALAERYGQLRAIHLRAHVQVVGLLSSEQITLYDQLRGYADKETLAPPAGADPSKMHHGQP
ncbi:MAG: hypothetical protein M3Q45_05060, partial [Chloroflexota bacterium]|nr:hypothetical protein [Chloroflexota bacterium]